MMLNKYPFVLIALSMISDIAVQADTENGCNFCQDSDCLRNKQPKIMDCSKEKMSSMNLTGKAQETWNFLLKESSELDDPAKYTKCVKIEYGSGPRNSGYLSGCAPEMVGEESYCDFAKQISGKHNSSDFSISQCSLCRPGDEDCLSYPVFFKQKTCFLCESRECYTNFDEVDCTSAKMSSYEWSGRSKEMWDLLAAGGAVLDDPNEYTNCVHLDWKNAEGKRGHIWGCAPDMVGEEKYCNYVNKTLMEKDYTLLDCETCRSYSLPCVEEAQVKEDANCYISQDPDELNPKRTMSCSAEKMSLKNLTGEAKNMWDLLVMVRPELEEASNYDRCFAMFWDHNGTSGFLSGCTSKLIDFSGKKFCEYVNETAAKNNYSLSKCQTTRATEEPSFYQAWQKPRKCYVCEDLECEKPSEILDCNEDRTKTHLEYGGDVHNFWKSLLYLTRGMMNLSHYNKCFGLSWGGGNHNLWSCAPGYVDNGTFCDYVDETATKEKIFNLKCHTCPATEEPCLKSLSWVEETSTTALTTDTEKKSDAMISNNHVVLWWIFSGVLLKIML